MGPVEGGAVNPSMGAWSRHPCRSHPLSRTHPTLDRLPRSVGTHGVGPRCCAMGSDPRWISISDRFHPRMAWIYWPNRPHVEYRYLEDVPTNGRHPPKQNAVLTDRGGLSKAGWVRLRGCERHGCRDQAPMDGFTAPPSTGPAPPTNGMQAFDVDVDSASAGLQALQKDPTTPAGYRAPGGCQSGSTAESPARPVSAAG